MLVVTALPGCSSVPDFKPSKPVEEASSLNEALELCAAYQIKGEQNASGRAQPARSVVLVPWIRCFERIFRKFGDARENQNLVMFHRALQSRHDGVPTSDAEVIDWPVMNYAVREAIVSITRPDVTLSREGLNAIERQLPDYWIYLAESNAFRKKPRGSRVHSTPLSTDIAPPRTARPMPLNDAQKDYCKRYLAYRGSLHNMNELTDYKRVLDQHTYEDVGNANERTMRERVNKRLENLKKETADGKAQLDRDLAAIKATASWFENGHCLQGTARMGTKR